MPTEAKAKDERGEHADIETLADEDSGELAERNGDEDEDAEVMAGDGEGDGEGEAGEWEDAGAAVGAGGWVVFGGKLPAEEGEGVEAEEQAVRAAFERVAKARGEDGHGHGDDGGAVAGEAADEEEEAELEEKETAESGQAQGDGVAPEDIHTEVRKQMVGGRV